MVADAMGMQFVNVALTQFIHNKIDEKTGLVQFNKFQLVNFHIHRLATVAGLVGVGIAFEIVTVSPNGGVEIKHLRET